MLEPLPQVLQDVTLFENRAFIDIIKLKSHHQGGCQSMAGVLIKRGTLDIDTRRGRAPRGDGGGDQGDA